MTFYTYMMRNYLNMDSPEGDLAYDMKHERDEFPRNKRGKLSDWHERIRNYLKINGACRECLEVFEECWKEYENCEKK